MKYEDLLEILRLHSLWLWGDVQGKKANLSEANLSRANLSGAYLPGANLSGANLSEANLSRANLSEANLSEANLSRAYLSGANLSEANLSRAYLSGANLTATVLPPFQIVPETGSFVGWKKLQGGVIAKLQIPSKAKRTSCLVNRKCRAEYVKVLKLFYPKDYEEQVLTGTHREGVIYNKGAIVYPDMYDDDIRIDCTNGIHFFMTRKEAEEWE